MNLKKKKILFLHHASGIGGAPLSLLSIVKRIDRQKYNPKVLFLVKSEVENLFNQNNINTRVLNNIKIFIHMEPKWYNWYHFYYILKHFIIWLYVAFYYSKRILKEEKPEILHLNSLFLTDWVFGAKQLGIPVICHVRESLADGHFGVRKFLIRKILEKYVDKIIAISYYNSSKINLPFKTRVIYNFVDFNEFDRNIGSKINQKKVVLYLGGHIIYKGFKVLVDSLEYLDDDILVFFAGYYYTNEKNKISHFLKLCISKSYKYRETSLKKMRKSKNAIEIGLTKSVPELIASCNLVVFPATKDHFPRPIIEAGAMAKPVVASDLPSIREVVVNNETGILFECCNAKDLAISINKICRDEKISEYLGNNGYKKALKNFDADLNTKMTFEIFNDLIY